MDSLDLDSILGLCSDDDDAPLSPPVVSKSYLDKDHNDGCDVSLEHNHQQPDKNKKIFNKNKPIDMYKQQDNQQATKQPENKPRCSFLITYAAADILKVGDRRQFEEMIAAEFDRNAVDGEESVVEKWAVGAELHRSEGVHYHCALKLLKARRWRQVRLNVKRQIGVDLDFRDFHDNFYDAFTYVVKQDSHYVKSENFGADLDNRPAPKTAAALRARRLEEAPSSSKSDSGKKRPRLDNATLYHIVTKNNIRTDKQLSAFATKQMHDGKDDLNRWVMNHPSKRVRQEILETAWQLVEAEDNLQRGKKNRMEILRDCLEWEHRTDSDTGVTCQGEWLKSAKEVLNLNSVPIDHFCALIRDALLKGRGKKRIIMIIGGTNRAKSFMFLPLLHIFDCFTCPSDASFNWVGAPEKEIILLNDVRYEGNGEGDKRFMKWRMLLNLLEGAPINISMPKNHFASDYQWVAKQPIFATAEHKIVRVMNHRLDEGETQQMDERWTYIEFSHKFEHGQINYNLVHCPRCFAQLLFCN